jgi:hypothetical protein
MLSPLRFNLKIKTMKENEEIILPSIGGIKKLLEPIYSRLEAIDYQIKHSTQKTNQSVKYYRNNDMKRIFGLSNNTIIKYREIGTLPFTRLGEIYLYEVAEIEQILTKNKVS